MMKTPIECAEAEGFEDYMERPELVRGMLESQTIIAQDNLSPIPNDGLQVGGSFR